MTHRKKNKKPPPQLKRQVTEPPPPKPGVRVFDRVFSGTKLLASLVLGAATILGAWASLRPHVSLEQSTLLDPSDPFSAQFTLTNESYVLGVRDVTSNCYVLSVITSNNVGIEAWGRNLPRTIPLLSPRGTTTVDCPPLIGGLGAGAGTVKKAKIVMTISYRQDWWWNRTSEQYPFLGLLDSQNVLRWTHRSPSEPLP
jgi:hypothetical protein